MEKNIRISVVVPIYKVEKYIHKCIQSILAQTYKNLEIILVDDGSPDRCGAICDSYAKEDPRIKVIHKQNGGLSDARNAGIDAAEGGFIGFVDSDDYIAPQMYEQLIKQLVKYNADIAVCKSISVKENQEAVFTDSDTVRVYEDNAARAMIYDNDFTVNAWNKLYRSKLFNNIRYPKGKLYEDLATTYQLIERAKKVVLLESIMYAYVQREGSIMNITGFMPDIDKMEIIETMWQFYLEGQSKYIKKIQAGIIRYCINDVFKMASCGNLVKNKNYRNELKNFLKGKKLSVFCNPYVKMYNKLIIILNLHCPGFLQRIYMARRLK